MGVRGTVTVRLFAAARDAAGVQVVELPAGSVAGLVRDLAQGRSARFARVLAISSLVWEGVRLDPTDPSTLPAGAVVDVLPPFAGG